MEGYRNFDRQYRLSVGAKGMPGFEIGEAVGVGKIPLHISFSIEKSDLTTQNTAKITVWNLNNAHLAALNEKDCVLSLKAGYGTRLPLIFAGTVTFSSTSLDGSDRKTDIELIDNLIATKDTYVSISYNGTVSWKKILSDAADQMGVVLSFSHNASFNDAPNGFSFVGPAKDILDKACKCCNLSWSIQNGILQIKKPGDTMSREVYVLSHDTGLIGIPKRVVMKKDENGKATQYGWDVVYFLNGAINVSDYVKLESKTISGYFTVYSLQIEGENQSGDWTCKARLLEVTA